MSKFAQYSAQIVTDEGVTVNPYSQGHIDSLILAVEFLRKHGRVLTSNDLADLLHLLGGPDMVHGMSERHQGLA